MRTLCVLFCIAQANFWRTVLGGETILLLHRNDILRLDVATKASSTILTADQPIVAFDIHQARNQIFWAISSAVFRTPMYDLETNTQIATVGSMGSLAVDWIHNQVYWTDLTEGRVEVSNLDGKKRRTVNQVRGFMGAMVLDPLLGKLFWIEWNDLADNKTKLKSCNLDGTQNKILYENVNLPRNTPLSIDVTLSGIFFYTISGNFTELEEIYYQTMSPMKEERIMFRRKGPAPKSLSLAKNGFYFSNKDGIFSAKWVNKHYTVVSGSIAETVSWMGADFTLLKKEMTDVAQIRVESAVSQPQWPDPCIIHSCEQECIANSHRQDGSLKLPNGPDYSCTCRYGYSLREDGKSCLERGYLFYSSGTTFGRIMTRGEYNTLLYNDSSDNIQTFDVDINTEYVYWSNIVTRGIYRAPIEQLTRREELISNVSAFGLAIDWIYNNLYWTSENSIMVSSLPKDLHLTLIQVDEVNEPADIAVDPINRFIFWENCGFTHTINRAQLDGSNISIMMRDDTVHCGLSLTTDPDTSTLYWLDWAGTVTYCKYDCSTPTKLLSEVVKGITIIDNQPLWIPIDHMSEEPTAEEKIDELFRDQLGRLAHDLQPAMVKAVKASQQPRLNAEDTELFHTWCTNHCYGICIPINFSNSSEDFRCLCPENNNLAVDCFFKQRNTKGYKSTRYLNVVDISAYNLTLQCGDILMKQPRRLIVHVVEVDSLVPRDISQIRKLDKSIAIHDRHQPFTVEKLNPATTYHLTVPNGVTRTSFSLIVHTPPPPLAVARKSIVIVPGLENPVSWRGQDIHYNVDNPWEHLVKREFLLLQISKSNYTLTYEPEIRTEVRNLLNKKIRDNYMILKHYKSKEVFDDDPIMILANTPWGERYWMAMVQVTKYKGSYNIDIVYSVPFSLPDPFWKPMVEDILNEQKDKELIDSIERV